MARAAQALKPREVTLAALQGRRFNLGDLVFQGVLLLSLLTALATLVTLLTDIITKGAGVLAERGVDFLTGPMSSLPDVTGVWLGLVGSLVIAMFVIVVAFPIGIGAAVYLEEYARDTRLTRFIDVNIRNLAGVPSIVYGLLGLGIFVTTLRWFTGGKTLMAAGLTMSVLVLPIIIISAAEALRAVPLSLREAGYGVGATRWEVVRHHVLPSAAPGILTGTIISLSRALGETAPLIMVGGITAYLTLGDRGVGEMLFSRFTALPVMIYGWSRRPDPGFREVTATAIIVLLAVILLANAAAIVLRNRYERRW